MKIKEIQELTPKELLARKREIKEEIFNLRIQKQSGQLERPHLLRVARRNIARIETVLSRKAGAASVK
ncbi:MAG: 50S ribosomal protein L29 [bacterium]